MPRPKRMKVAPSGPTQRNRSTFQVLATSNAISNTPKPAFDDMYDVSDPEDRAATRTRLVGSARKEKALETPLKRAGSTSRSKPSGKKSSHEEDEELRADGDLDLADNIEDSSSPEVEVGRREKSTPGMDSSVFGFSNFRRHARQRSIPSRGPGRARSSSVESNLADDNGLTSVGRKNTSTQTASRFQRQPQQQSVIGGNNMGVAPSSMALEMTRGTPAVGSALKLANFKRRPRQSSILGTARKPRNYQSDMGEDDDEEDDFNPDDESTPLNLSKTRSMTNSSAAAKSSSSRKRKLSAVQVSQSQSSPSRNPSPFRSVEETVPATGPLDDEEEDENLEPTSPQEAPLPSIEGSAPPEPMSETMALPQSSSSAPSSPEPVLPVPRGRGRQPVRGRRTKTPPARTQDSPISSPPSLTHSPNRPYMSTNNPTTRKVPPPPSTYSTAQLQDLLPRRRRRTTRDPFDIPISDGEVDTSGLASDDDELSHLNVRGRRPRSTLSRTPAPAKKGPKAKAASKPASKTIPRTYGARRNTTSDKENEELDPDDSLAPLRDDGNESPENSQELEKRVGKELKKAARKFQEVDKWELEFEDVTPDTSSPANEGR